MRSFVLFVFMLTNLWAVDLSAQLYMKHERDTILSGEHFRLEITRIPDSETTNRLQQLKESNFNRYRNPVLFDFDSVRMYLKDRVEFDTMTFEWDREQNVFIEAMRSKNGMKLVFRGPASFEKYYPVEEIIVFGNNHELPRWVFNSKTGENDYEPAYTVYAGNATLRVVADQVSDESLCLSLQAFQLKEARYVTLLNLSDFFETAFHPDAYFWGAQTLFLFHPSALEWWRITVKEKSLKILIPHD